MCPCRWWCRDNRNFKVSGGHLVWPVALTMGEGFHSDRSYSISIPTHRVSKQDVYNSCTSFKQITAAVCPLDRYDKSESPGHPIRASAHSVPLVKMLYLRASSSGDAPWLWLSS